MKQETFKKGIFKEEDVLFIKPRNLKVFSWGYGEVSLSYDKDKPDKPYFVLSDKSRKRLIRLLTMAKDKPKALKKETLKRLEVFKKGYNCFSLDSALNMALDRWEFD